MVVTGQKMPWEKKKQKKKTGIHGQGRISQGNFILSQPEKLTF